MSISAEINFIKEFFNEFGLSKKQIENQVNLYLKFRKECIKELKNNLTDDVQITQAHRDGEITFEEIMMNIKRFAKIQELEEKKIEVKISDLVDVLDFLSKEELFIWWMNLKDLDKYPIKIGIIMFDHSFVIGQASQDIHFHGPLDPASLKIVIGDGYVINTRSYPRLDKIITRKLDKKQIQYHLEHDYLQMVFFLKISSMIGNLTKTLVKFQRIYLI